MYPALAVLNELQISGVNGVESSELCNMKTLWVGGEGGMEGLLVARQGISFAAIPAAGVHGVGLRALPGNLLRLARGIFAARRILKEFKPDVLFFTGGYVAVPMAVAGWRIPSLLYVPDIEPGLALKFLARFADRITVTTPTSIRYFAKKERVVATGYPTRANLSLWNKASAREAIGLSDDLPVLLVFGGSRGARSINNALLKNLPALLKKAQIVHISGELDWRTADKAKENLSREQAARYHLFAYLHDEMGAALASADLAISRAGASTLGEFPLFGLPALLVPYPHAWRYQKVNADYLSQRGAALIIEDEALAEQLETIVSSLLENPAKLEAMRDAMKRVARPQAADKIGEHLLSLAGKRKQ